MAFEILVLIILFIVSPGLVLYLVGRNNKAKIEVEKLKMQKEVLELEVRKNESAIRLLQEEGKKYDKIIDGDQK